MNYLGIDWGKSKIGIAYGEGETGMAFAVGAEKNDEDFFSKVCHLLETYEADTFVIGYSEIEEQDDNADLIRSFTVELEKRCGKPTVFAEEMFSTREAQENLKAAGRTRISQKDDAEAARVILQAYMDRIAHNA